ncbi:Polynucleotidyl transferase ribonuclease H-like superfamily protein [Euphorbia peplus]|nr:Polynucleotidyl transferase ribonuclease H-like superfamily protein [Euphorbia peplus]
MNKAFLAKLGWQCITNTDSLWSKVICAKYFRNTPSISNIEHKKVASSTWRGIVKAKTVLQSGLRHRVGNGRGTLFWTDPWLFSTPIISLINIDIDYVDKFNTVFFYWGDNDWNWEVLDAYITNDIRRSLQAVYINTDSNNLDVISWSASPDGYFTVKSAYNSQFVDPIISLNLNWKSIWKIQVPYKICTFLWIALHGKLMGNFERSRRNFTNSDMCSICNRDPETTLHILRDCPKAKQVWSSFIPNSLLSYWFNLNLQDWIMYNLNSFKHPDFLKDWKVFFSHTIWWIWRWRCISIFEGKEQPAWIKVKFLKTSLIQLKEAFRSESFHQQHVVTREDIDIGWIPPETHCFKLNTDGCSKGNPGPARAGGVIRDHEGRWIAGFSFNIGICTAIQAEMWAILKGLELAWSLGISQLEVDCDSELAVHWINKKTGNSGLCNNLISACGNLLDRNWLTKVTHSYRESNRVADKLANLALHLDYGVHNFQQCPNEVVSDLWYDIIGTTWPRTISLS